MDSTIKLKLIVSMQYSQCIMASRGKKWWSFVYVGRAKFRRVFGKDHNIL